MYVTIGCTFLEQIFKPHTLHWNALTNYQTCATYFLEIRRYYTLFLHDWLEITRTLFWSENRNPLKSWQKCFSIVSKLLELKSCYLQLVFQWFFFRSISWIKILFELSRIRFLRDKLVGFHQQKVIKLYKRFYCWIIESTDL